MRQRRFLQMHHNLRSPEHRPSVPQMAENVDECTTECHDNLEVQIYGLWDLVIYRSNVLSSWAAIAVMFYDVFTNINCLWLVWTIVAATMGQLMLETIPGNLAPLRLYTTASQSKWLLHQMPKISMIIWEYSMSCHGALNTVWAMRESITAVQPRLVWKSSTSLLLYMALLIRPILAHAKLLSEPVHHERCEAPMHDSGSPSQTYSFLTLLGQSTDAMTYISTITALSLGLSGRDLPRAGLNLYTFIPIYLIYGAEGVTYVAEETQCALRAGTPRVMTCYMVGAGAVAWLSLAIPRVLAGCGVLQRSAASVSLTDLIDLAMPRPERGFVWRGLALIAFNSFIIVTVYTTATRAIWVLLHD